MNYISQKEAKELFELEKKFIKSYAKHKDNMNLNDWLQFELKNNLPEKNEEEIFNISKEIIETIDTNEKNKALLKEARNNGRSKESWFASRIKESLSYMSVNEFGNTLLQLDEIIKSNNEAMIDVITTKAGNINMNPNLDGFIAEQYHVNSFNRNAKLKGSEYIAEALVPKDGQTYGKNSVDIVIKDRNGKIVRKYQSKFCKDSEATNKAFEHGDYRGQRKLVPKDQNIENASDYIQSPDGKIKSEPISKNRAKELKDEAQSGNYKQEDWNSFNTKQLATNIGKEVGKTTLYGAAIGTGFYIAQKVIDEENVEIEEVIEVAIKTGTDAGIKAAISSAIKVGTEKGMLNIIPKGTPAHIITNIVYIGVENIKIAKKVFDRELTAKEAIDEMEVTTVSMVAGSVIAAKGAAIGASTGSILGPIGTVVGGFVGGTVGYMAGSEMWKVLTKEGKKIRDTAKEMIINMTNSFKESKGMVFSSVKNKAISLFS